jgi:hypothetical protein
MESFVTSMPQLAAALSVWRPAAGVADEVLAVGVPYLKSLAQASASWRRERGAISSREERLATRWAGILLAWLRRVS